jgi:hypothetical protein
MENPVHMDVGKGDDDDYDDSERNKNIETKEKNE